MTALQTAANLKLPTIVLTNSWKDVFHRPRVALPLTALGVPTRREARRVLAVNPGLSPHAVHVVGPLHLAALRAAQGPPDRVSFCARYGLDPERPIVCYTTAAPRVAPGEAGVVEGLLRSCERGELPGRPQLLLRLNPMDDGRRFQALSESQLCAIQRPAWEWCEAEEWCCPLPADAAEWAATLENSVANVSLPSTTTLEFAAWGKPTINVCWGPGPGQLWRAEFYGEVRERGWAFPTYSSGQLRRRLAQALAGDLPKPSWEARFDSVSVAAEILRAAIEDRAPSRRAVLGPARALLGS